MHRACGRGRPGVEVAPPRAQDVDGRGRVEDAARTALHDLLEEAQLPVVDDGRSRLWPGSEERFPGPVLPGPDDELLPARGLLEADEILERPLEEDVVPAADMEAGNLDPRVVRVDRRLLPVVVVGGVLEPVGVVRRIFPREGGRVGQREVPEPVRAAGASLEPRDAGPVLRRERRVVGKARRPVGREREREGAAVVRPALVVLRRRHAGADRHEARRPLGCGEELGGAGIGEAVHRHPAVRALEAGCPLDGVVAVPGLVTERVEVALGAEPPAAVLDDDHPALTRPPGRMSVARACSAPSFLSYGSRIRSTGCDASTVGR